MSLHLCISEYAWNAMLMEQYKQEMPELTYVANHLLKGLLCKASYHSYNTTSDIAQIVWSCDKRLRWCNLLLDCPKDFNNNVVTDCASRSLAHG